MTDVCVKPDDGKGLEHYARLLKEAHREKGISLWRDAWRRLRRNKASMVSLVFLVLLSISALLTPLLPLQSPVEQHLGDGAFQAPNTTAVSLPLLEMRQEYDDTIAQLEDRLDAAGTAKQRIEIENEIEATVLNSLFERY